MTNQFKLGYVIGFIVGEASFSGDKKKPRLAVKQKDNLKPLKACVEMFGGRINGPYTYTYQDGVDRTYHIWSLDGPELVSALPVLEKNMPDCEKRMRLFEWKKKYNL